jgi:group I intron endonuclease
MGIIYCATNKFNGKVYIGLTTKGLSRRKLAHYSDARNNIDGSYFHRAIRKHGDGNFKWEIIDENNDLKILKMLERLYIARYESMDHDIGYNITEGGDGNRGLKHSEESKRKIGLASKGRKHTNETKKLISQHSKGENNPIYGQKRPEELKKTVSQKQHGKGLFGFTGVTYKNKHIKPYYRVWNSKIGYNKNRKSLGMYNDPVSAEIIYMLVWNEIYNGGKD